MIRLPKLPPPIELTPKIKDELTKQFDLDSNLQHYLYFGRMSKQQGLRRNSS